MDRLAGAAARPAGEVARPQIRPARPGRELGLLRAPRPNLGMVPQQQVPAGRKRQELRTADVLCGVLAKAERVKVVIPGVND